MTDSPKVKRSFSILSITLLVFAFVVLIFCAGLVLICLTLFFPNDSWRHYVNGGSYSSNSGTMSPDGEYLVFSSPKSGRGDLWRLSLKDSIMHQITNSEDFESYPLYSPDGENILYVREHSGHQHIWKTDKEGQFHEQLTFGWVTDELVDVSPNGESLLIRRSYSQAGGQGMVAGPTLVYSLSNKKLTEVGIGECRYLDNHTLLYNTRYNVDEEITRFGEYDLASQQTRTLGDGYLECLSPNKKIICISRDSNRNSLNAELFLFDLEEQSEQHIGTGRYPCFLGDSKVVFFIHPFHSKAFVYSLEDGTTDKVELPGTISTTPTATYGDCGVLLRLRSPSDRDRSGNIYLFRNNCTFLSLSAAPVQACPCPPNVREAKSDATEAVGVQAISSVPKTPDSGAISGEKPEPNDIDINVSSDNSARKD